MSAESATTNIAPGNTTASALNNIPSGNINGILVINSSGYNAYIGDANKIVLFKIAAGQGVSLPYRSGGGLYCWTDGSVAQAGFGTMGNVRVTVTVADVQLSGGVIIDAYNVPVATVQSFNGRSGVVALTNTDVVGVLGSYTKTFNTRVGDIILSSADVTGALAFTPANSTNVVNTFNGRLGAVTLLSADVTGALAFTPANSANVVNTFNGRLGAVTLAVLDVRNVYSSYLQLPVAVAVTASPFTFQNALTTDQTILISGGTVSLVEFTRDNVTFYPIVASYFYLSPNDRVRVTYTVAPTMTRIPR